MPDKINSNNTETQEQDNIIFAYTWDDAINDGTFIRVDDTMRQEAGIKVPTAITANLYSKYIKNKDEKGRLWDILNMLKHGKIDGNMSVFTVKLGRENVTLWATIEARSPTNPEPIMTIMTPEDY